MPWSACRDMPDTSREEGSVNRESFRTKLAGTSPCPDTKPG
jgi:hypothetical protein